MRGGSAFVGALAERVRRASASSGGDRGGGDNATSGRVYIGASMAGPESRPLFEQLNP